MTEIITKNTRFQKTIIWVMLLNSLLITLFLAFIDEGNYNFNWIYDLGSWVAIVIYVVVFFAVQFICFKTFRFLFGKSLND